MEAREYLKLATDKTEAGDLIEQNNLTEAIVKMLDNYALIRVKNCSIPDVSGMFSEKQMEQAWTDGASCGETRSGFFDIENYR